MSDSDIPQAIGDPTEIALVVAADRLGLCKEELEQLFPRLAEAPFDSGRKRMTTVHRVEREDGTWKYPNGSSSLLPNPLALSPTPYIAFTKGSVDGLLQISNKVWNDHSWEPLNADWQEKIRDSNDRLAASGTRVLGLPFVRLNNFQLQEPKQPWNKI